MGNNDWRAMLNDFTNQSNPSSTDDWNDFKKKKVTNSSPFTLIPQSPKNLPKLSYDFSKSPIGGLPMQPTQTPQAAPTYDYNTILNQYIPQAKFNNASNYTSAAPVPVANNTPMQGSSYAAQPVQGNQEYYQNVKQQQDSKKNVFQKAYEQAYKEVYDPSSPYYNDWVPDWLQLPVRTAGAVVTNFAPTQRILQAADEALGVPMRDVFGNEVPKATTGSGLVDKALDLAGNLGAYAKIGDGGGVNALNFTDDAAKTISEKLVPKLANAPKVVQNLAPTFARGAIDNGLSTAAEDVGNGKDIGTTAKDTLINAGFGGLLFAGGKGVADAVGGKFKTKLPTQEEINPIETAPEQPIINSKVEPTEKVVSSANEAKMTDEVSPMKFSKIMMDELAISKADDIDELDNTINGLGEMITKETDPVAKSKLQNLQSLAEKRKKEISKFKTNTLKKAEFLQGEETQKLIDSIDMSYEVKTNEKTVQNAAEALERDFNGIKNRIAETGLKSAEDSAAAALITKKLREQADISGDYSELGKWLKTVQPSVTNVAQTLQAMSTWKKMTVEGALNKAQQVVDKVNREGEKTYGKNFKPVELTDDDMKSIVDTMKKVEKLPDGEIKDREFAKVKKIIADKIPPTMADKIKTLQRISLLLNPKTQVRNVLGNTILGTLENTKDVIAAPLDKGITWVGKKLGKDVERTTLFPTPKGLATQAKGMGKGFVDTLKDFKENVSTSPSKGQYDLPEGVAFTGKNPISKGLRVVERATNSILELGDRPFYQAAYDEALRQQMKINKVTTATEKMMEKAKAIAEDRTLQNVTSLVKGFQKLQKGLNELTGNEKIGIGTFAIPFAKTPANILDKAIDYSPIGTIKGLSQLMSKKTFNQKLFVDRIGRSLTGSAIMYLGYDLAKNGLLTGQSNSDKDVAAFEKQTGKTAYSIKTGDTYNTIDWAQPAAIPLMIGADIYLQGKNTKEAKGAIWDAIKSGGNTLFQQSLLQGMQRLFGGTTVVDGVMNTVTNIPTQFVPTFMKQAAQMKDDTVRSTYDPDKNMSILNGLKAKIPGLSEQLQPKVDTLGREVKQFGGNNNWFNVLVNPGYTNTSNPTDVEKMIMDIYNDTGSKAHFPRVVDTKITYKVDKDNSQTVQLTPKEITEFQKYIGLKTNEEYSKLLKSGVFKAKDSKEKAKYLQSILTKIYNEGEEYILKGRGIREYKKK